MKKYALLIILSLVLVFSNSLLITAAQALAWPEALKLAEENNHDIKSSQKQLDASQWTYYKAFSNFLPQISASASAGNSASEAGTSERYSYGLSLSQSLFKGLSNYHNLRSAEINLDYYRLNLQKTKADVFYSVRLAFIDLYLAQVKVEVQQKIKQSREENARMIKLLYDSGKEDKGNYLRTQAQLADAEHDAAQAKRQLELAQLKLDQMIGCGEVVLDGLAEAAPVEAPDIDKLANNSPAYLMAKDQLAQAEIANNKTISEYLPSVSLAAGWQKSGGSWPPSSSSKSLAISASIPLFPGGSNIATSLINGLLLEKAKEDFAQSRKDNYYGLKETHGNLEDTVEAYGVQKLYFTASEERAKIAQVKYLNGLMSYNDWDQVQNEYISNQTSLLNYNRSALAAEAGWYKSYGEWIK